MNKCEELGFVHAWQDITENIIYPTNPPQYPPRKRKCMNCGQIQQLVVKQREIKDWELLKEI